MSPNIIRFYPNMYKICSYSQVIRHSKIFIKVVGWKIQKNNLQQANWKLDEIEIGMESYLDQ